MIMVRYYDSQIRVRFRQKDYFLDLSSKEMPVTLNPKEKQSVYPVHIGADDEDPYYIVYVTDICNMQCSYCFNKISKTENLRNEQPAYSYSQLVDYFCRQGYKEKIYIRFFGGEPLLNKKWIYGCVAEIKRRNINATYNIFTNTTLLDEEFLNFAEENEFEFYTSINGGKDSYKGGYFKERICEGIRKLRERQFYVNARMVWIPNEQETLVDLVKEAIGSGLKVVSVVLPLGMKEDEILYELFASQLEEFADFYLGKILEHNYKYVGIDPFVSYISKWILDKEYGDVSCGAGKNVICIATDGKCYPCHCFVNIAEYVSGTVHEGSKPLFTDLAADTIVPCKNCEIRYFCKAKCYADAFYTHEVPYRMNELKCKTEKMFVGASAYILSELIKRKEEYAAFKYILSRGAGKYSRNR